MTKDIYGQKILILDFGSQYTQLIARRVRETQVYCEIHPFRMSLARIKTFEPRGIILSGGPSSIYDKAAPLADEGILDLHVPVLGICYGMQYLTHVLGGLVARAENREYGNAAVRVKDFRNLFHGMSRRQEELVWMSHGDRIDRMPQGFKVLASSKSSPVAAMADPVRRLYRGPVSSGSRPYAERDAHPQELSLQDLRMRAPLDHELLCGKDHSGSEGEDRQGPGDLRCFGRRGFHRDGRSPPQGHRRTTHLHFR